MVGQHPAMELTGGGECRGGHDELADGAHGARKGAGRGCCCEK